MKILKKMTGFREKMARSIVEQGDKLITKESWNDGAVVMWIIYDHESEGDPFGRAPQFQVWKGDKRCYVGPDIQCAYHDFKKQKEQWIAEWALI